MSDQQPDPDDVMLDAFLRGEDALSRRLKTLPQPAPAPELSAAILARAEQDLRAMSAANDDTVAPGARSLPFKPHFLRRIGVPFGLAASVALATFVVLQMRHGLEPGGPQIVARSAPVDLGPAAASPPATQPMMAPQAGHAPAAPAPDASRQNAAPGVRAPVRAAQEPVVVEKRQSGTPQAGRAEDAPTVIARAETAEPLLLRSAPPMPAPVPPAPADEAREGAAEPRSWLDLIRELHKAGLKRDAVEEWIKFRKKFPHYAVPESLSREMGSLQKAFGLENATANPNAAESTPKPVPNRQE